MLLISVTASSCSSVAIEFRTLSFKYRLISTRTISASATSLCYAQVLISSFQWPPGQNLNWMIMFESQASVIAP